eukprot:TRINITY_DN10823_c0_g2_i1.p1 TRINITY_DN10823_c0_g2~~TRINITY_DN10823_c0_g2_i1.p1  ORF type:complete len:781 (+),score=86.13 TRINITY_DN10823_c0_g2_i1:86-2428(+)
MASIAAERRHAFAPTPTLLSRPSTSRESTDSLSTPMIDAPKTGMNTVLIHPPPSFLNLCPSMEEPFLVQDQKALIESSQKKDFRRSLSSGSGRIVYDSVDSAPKPLSNHPRNLISILQHGNLTPYYVPVSSSDKTLCFESRFESGNLRRAICINEFEYDLILRPDSSKKAYTQWFFFSVSNFVPGTPYTFNMINMYKPDSLHNYGMQPVVYSHIESTTRRMGWFRGGQNICYFRNNIRRNKTQFYYTLSFTYTFKHAEDLCYFAQCYPYTYSNLQTDLMMLEADPERRKLIKRRPLCQTSAGNTCELLTITAFSSSTDAIRNRRGIVITARVHPGETCASWIMKGFLYFITGPSPDARFLRENFVFKVIPILNPDGVVNGSYRCSLYGDDLNRHWAEPSKTYHPTIYHAKIMIQNLLADRPVLLFCDYHGHSRKRNVFIYGCGEDAATRTREDRVFPRLLEMRNRMYSYSDSRFSVQKSKISTARVVMRREFDISHSYTLEASLAGYYRSEMPLGMHFNLPHFQMMGEVFCLSLADYLKERVVVQRLVDELYVTEAPAPQQEFDSDDSEYSSEEETSSKLSGKHKKKKKKHKSKKGDGRGDKSPKRTSSKSKLPDESGSKTGGGILRSTSTGILQPIDGPKPPTPSHPRTDESPFPGSCLKERLKRLHQAANDYFLRSLYASSDSSPLAFEARNGTPLKEEDVGANDEESSHKALSARVRSMELDSARISRQLRPSSALNTRNILTIRRIEPTMSTITLVDPVSGFMNAVSKNNYRNHDL